MKLLFLISLLFLYIPTGRAGSSPSGGRIMFLVCTMNSDETITLKKTMVVPGILRRGMEGGNSDILYEVTGNSGDTLVRGELNSPLVRHFDYQDPDNPSMLKGGVIMDTTAEFIVRIPYQGSPADISFIKREFIRSGGMEKRQSADAISKGRLLGRFSLPRQGDGE